MTLMEFSAQYDANAMNTHIPETAARTEPEVVHRPEDHVPERDELLHLFVDPEDLYASTDWGDLLRLVNFQFDNVRLVAGPDRTWRLLLCNPATGMWRMQGRPDFQPLADVMLADANWEALRLAAAKPIVLEKTRRKLERHVETTGGGSITRALRRAPRLAEDPTLPISRVDISSPNEVRRCPVLMVGGQTINLLDGISVSSSDLQNRYLLDMTPGPTPYVPDAFAHETPGAVMMRRFLHYLGNGDPEIIARRLGWHLCGHHATLDVIAGDHGALRLLARALRETLGPTGDQHPVHGTRAHPSAGHRAWNGSGPAVCVAGS